MSNEFCDVVDGFVLYKNVKIPLTRYYANFLETQPEEYWNYETTALNWSSPHGIEIVRKIGRGKYSEVFDGLIHFENSVKDCVIKVLRPVKKKKIRREISILINLRKGVNIVKLIEIIKDPITKTLSLITERVNNLDFRKLYPLFTDYDVRYYIFQLLLALDYCHSHGIMHRDVKPHNIMYDYEKRSLRLIDWGLAEFYHPGKLYNVRVASRFYKPPELLVDFQAYDYSLDMWSTGCVLATLIFKKEPFFNGSDNFNQLVKIIAVLGYEDFVKYQHKYNISLPPEIPVKSVSGYKKTPLTDFINSENAHLANPEAIDLLDKLLRYDHAERILPCEALELSYFDMVRTDCLQHLSEQNLVTDSLTRVGEGSFMDP